MHLKGRRRLCVFYSAQQLAMTIFVVINCDISGLKTCSIGNDHLNGAACLERLTPSRNTWMGMCCFQAFLLQTTRNLPKGMGRSHREELINNEAMRVRKVVADVKFAKVIYQHYQKQGRKRSMMLFVSTTSVMNVFIACVI
jgi:hypothetical protein